VYNASEKVPAPCPVQTTDVATQEGHPNGKEAKD
jgi:hypothetical protein